jgi:polysaccharide pyruvyl transferase WcaK-like protein
LKVVISDAYSPTNVGDGELVRLSIRSVRSRFGVHPTVLCTDRRGFESDAAFEGSRFVFKPLSRVRWRSLDRVRRLSMVLRDAAGLALALFAGALPTSMPMRRRILLAIGTTLRIPWLSHVGSADILVAVGGGYIGDKYLRESLISLALFRVARSVGAQVETMPMSISSAENRVLRWTLRRFGRGVHWRGREMTTHRILTKLNLRVDGVPDLAWLNAAEEYKSSETTSLIIAPLGSDFYGAQDAKEPKIWSHIRAHIAELKAGERVSLIAMHYWDDRLQDGRDDRECERVAAMIRELNPSLEVTVLTVRSYEEVLEHMASAKLAVCERLHAALAGLAVGTQTKVVGYEPKHRGVMEMAGLEVLTDESVSYVLERVSHEHIAARGAEQAFLTHKAVLEV